MRDMIKTLFCPSAYPFITLMEYVKTMYIIQFLTVLQTRYLNISHTKYFGNISTELYR